MGRLGQGSIDSGLPVPSLSLGCLTSSKSLMLSGPLSPFWYGYDIVIDVS